MNRRGDEGPDERDRAVNDPGLDAPGKYAEYNDFEIPFRPNPRGSRPRTKTRPDHADATQGRVLSVDRGRYSVLLNEDTQTERLVTATRARELHRHAVVTGDRVDVVGDVSGDVGTLVRIVRVEPRTTVLRRSADDTDSIERIAVANADQMLIVVAAANPQPRTRLVDRYLVAAFDAGIVPLLCITKTDLADPLPFLENVTNLDLQVFTSGFESMPLAALRSALANHKTVVVGPSGVGKSTLFNELVPDAHRATGRVNDVTGRGRHTSSSTIALRLSTPDGTGWVIDTPGVRSFGLGHVDPSSILKGFADLAPLAEKCPRGCTHLRDSPDCAIVEAIKRGELGDSGRARFDSLQRLLETLTRPASGHER
jgi:ribosome biogenesis GTPase